MMTTYNPCQAEAGVLYPCHSIIVQFYVSGAFLDMYVYNRSQDLFLGVPFNIASAALLCHVIAKLTKKTPRDITMGLGDAHIYTNHIKQAHSQVAREPYPAPVLSVSSIASLDALSTLTVNDFQLSNYVHHAPGLSFVQYTRLK